MGIPAVGTRDEPPPNSVSITGSASDDKSGETPPGPRDEIDDPMPKNGAGGGRGVSELIGITSRAKSVTAPGPRVEIIGAG